MKLDDSVAEEEEEDTGSAQIAPMESSIGAVIGDTLC